MSADRLCRPLAALFLVGLGACEWFTDFKDQPRIEPWESYAIGGDTINRDTIPFRGQPPMSVPVTGAMAPGFWVSYTPGIAQLDSMSILVNPTAPSAASLANGRLQYQINCAVCHGVAGQGNGPVTLYGYPAPSVVSGLAQGYSDGYLFGIIRNGRGLMPNYNRIEESDRWDLVNYLRGLQGRTQVSIEPLAAPGITGPEVPGATRMAPTRPAPYTSEVRTRSDTAVSRGAPLQTGTMPGQQPPAQPDTAGAAVPAGAPADTTAAVQQAPPGPAPAAPPAAPTPVQQRERL